MQNSVNASEIPREKGVGDMEKYYIMDEAALELEEDSWPKVAAKLVYDALIQLRGDQAGRFGRGLSGNPTLSTAVAQAVPTRPGTSIRLAKLKVTMAAKKFMNLARTRSMECAIFGIHEFEQFATEPRDWQEFLAFQQDARDRQPSDPADTGADTLLHPQDELLKACRTKLSTGTGIERRSARLRKRLRCYGRYMGSICSDTPPEAS